MNYGIREGYTINPTPKYFIDDQYDGKHWQPDALPIAAHLARLNNRDQFVDIGCGRGEKLVKYADEFSIIGIDHGENIEYAKSHHSVGDWYDFDLEYGFRSGANWSNRVGVCADVIEHLVNPLPLVLSLYHSVLYNGLVVLTTPDRERVYGCDHSGAPENPSHVREWTLTELRNWLAVYSLTPVWQGWTLNNDVERNHHTILMILDYPITGTGYSMSVIDDLENLFDLERAV